jgi:hypothetical protein
MDESLAPDLELGAELWYRSRDRLRARPVAAQQRRGDALGQSRERRDLLERAGAAEQVRQVGIGGAAGVAEELQTAGD